jgi:hypothetical protein
MTSTVTPIASLPQQGPLSGDITTPNAGSTVTTLATVNADVGTFGDATDTVTLTVNAKGLITAVSQNPIDIADSGGLLAENNLLDLYSISAAITNLGAQTSILNVNPQTSDYVLQPSDFFNSLVTITSATPVTVTLPQTSTNFVSGGSTCPVLNLGTGLVTFAVQGIDTVAGVLTLKQNAQCAVEKINEGFSQNNWNIVGGTPVAANSQSSTLAIGTAYQNTLTDSNSNPYDILLVVFLSITVATSATIKLGVGSSSTPTQQTIYNALSTTGVISIPIYIPAGHYALLSTSGTITAAITGQLAMPI